MKNRKYISIMICALLSLSLVIAGCSKKQAELPPQYPGWITYTYKHFIFHYPKDSYWGKKMDSFSSSYERFLEEDCGFLGIEIPKDTIHFYIHNNPEDGQKLTGRVLPFHTDNQIHWDRRTPWGLELARFLIDRMDLRMTDFKFLYDGLATLLDYSEYNYHQNTISLMEMKRFIPLDTLVNNDSYARADSLWREWEAASMVGFITYNFGINRFKMLWQSAASFDESIKQLFGVDLEKFQSGWLTFARKYYEGMPAKELYLDSAKANIDTTAD